MNVRGLSLTPKKLKVFIAGALLLSLKVVYVLYRCITFIWLTAILFIVTVDEMAEGNGDVSIKEETDVERTQDYHKLLDYGLDSKVAAKLDEIYQTGKKHLNLIVDIEVRPVSSN